MFDNFQGGSDYDDIVGELAAIVVQQCSHGDIDYQVGSSVAAAAVVAAVGAGVVAVVAVEATD